MLDEKEFELLQRYVDDIATVEERKHVDTQLQASEIWQEELAALAEMQSYIDGIEKREDFRTKLTAFHKDYISKNPNHPNNRRFLFPKRLWSVAASLALIAVFFFYNENKSSDGIYAEFLTHDTWEYIDKSSSDNANVAIEIGAAYQKEAYADVLALYPQLSAVDQKAYLLYKGISELKIDKTPEAIVSFQQLLEDAQMPAQKDKAHWYLALAYLKINDKVEVRKNLNKVSGADQYYKKKAEELLKAL